MAGRVAARARISASEPFGDRVKVRERKNAKEKDTPGIMLLLSSCVVSSWAGNRDHIDITLTFLVACVTSAIRFRPRYKRKKHKTLAAREHIVLT